MGLFLEISLIIFSVTLVSVVMRLLRQPLVIGYIVSGILVGPYYLNILQADETIELFSKIGIAILLFIVGLHLRPSVIKEVGVPAMVTGIGQVVFTSLLGYGLTRVLGFAPLESLYIAVALTFSSTIIILKLLSDKGDLGTLYGRISIGFLLVQDIIASLILLFIAGMSGAAGSASPGLLFLVIMVKGVAVVLFLYALVRYVLPRLTRFFSSSQEFLFLASIAWGLGVASLFHAIGLSVEVGALIAGVALSMAPFADEMASRLKPLRDFFIILFFVFLGSQLELGGLVSHIGPAVILSLFVLLGNPLIVFVLMNALGYKSRIGFLAGLTVAQISEFSLILVALGVSQGHVSPSVLTLVTIVGLVTIAGSTYMIMYGKVLFATLKPALRFLEWRAGRVSSAHMESGNYEALLFGYDRGGDTYVEAVHSLTSRFAVIDINPTAIERLQRKGLPWKYGDAEDPEFLAELPMDSIRLVISTIPDFSVNHLLVKRIRRVNKRAIILVVGATITEARALYTAGTTFVIMPNYLGADYTSRLIGKYGFSPQGFRTEKKRHAVHMDKHEPSADSSVAEVFR